jgi:hypothetical protein
MGTGNKGTSRSPVITSGFLIRHEPGDTEIVPGPHPERMELECTLTTDDDAITSEDPATITVRSHLMTTFFLRNATSSGTPRTSTR